MVKLKCWTCRGDALMLVPRNKPRHERWPVCRNCGPAQGTPLPAVSEGMVMALSYAWQVEGCTKLLIARQLAAPGARAYAYRTIDRAIEADLIKATKDGRAYRVYPTALGLAILGQPRVAA